MAPATMHALRRSQAQDEEEVTEKEEENRRAEGREALSRAVAMAVELSHRPHPVHGDRIKSKFWATADESDQDDGPDPSTPEFIQEAVDAGFTCDQLAKAEHVLHSGKTPSSDDLFQKQLLSGCYTGNSLGKHGKVHCRNLGFRRQEHLGILLRRLFSGISVFVVDRGRYDLRGHLRGRFRRSQKNFQILLNPQKKFPILFFRLYHEVRPRSRLRRFQPRLSAPGLVWGRKQISGVMGLTIKF